jgi:hypothetical protein
VTQGQLALRNTFQKSSSSEESSVPPLRRAEAPQIGSWKMVRFKRAPCITPQNARRKMKSLKYMWTILKRAVFNTRRFACYKHNAANAVSGDTAVCCENITKHKSTVAESVALGCSSGGRQVISCVSDNSTHTHAVALSSSLDINICVASTRSRYLTYVKTVGVPFCSGQTPCALLFKHCPSCVGCVL